MEAGCDRTAESPETRTIASMATRGNVPEEGKVAEEETWGRTASLTGAWGGSWAGSTGARVVRMRERGKTQTKIGLRTAENKKRKLLHENESRPSRVGGGGGGGIKAPGPGRLAGSSQPP